MSRILVIDDDRALCRSLQIQLDAEGHETRCAHSAAAGRELAAAWSPHIVLLDLVLPDSNGLEVLEDLLTRLPGLPVVMITGVQDMKSTIAAMRLGACDYIRKPIGQDDLLLAVEKARRFGAAGLARSGDAAGPPVVGADDAAEREIIGRDPEILAVLKQIGLLSRGDVTVLIEGESGTGKELVARALHDATCPDQPFVAINCSSIVSTLPESELFGYERGAFTGADRRKIGKFEHARAGTVFLDEIGDLALTLQAKLLRVLQEREFERVGGLEALPFKARVIAATNRDLDQMVREDRFRDDLYYRLAVSRIRIPPLRDRQGDIPLLVDHLVKRIARRIHRRVDAVEEDALQLLTTYGWPGNVRELENVLTRAITLAHTRVLTVNDLAFSLGRDRTGAAQRADAEYEKVLPLREAERLHIRRALAATGWNITQTARLLEISPTTLRKKIADYDLHR
jgi:two-component system response regulator AtoC